MHIEQLRDFSIAIKGVTEHFPFDESTLVFKVMNKMFMMVPLDRWENGAQNIVIKLNPEKAIELREMNESILGGFQQGRKPDAKYVNVKHWNTVIVNQGVSDAQVCDLIKDAYQVVVDKLTKKLKAELENL
ncbi:MAG: MmcQ/YjbR family DNA-binding protein [Polaribacter sp.]|jgi:predicted DNA-binding protein (MmcQ/YjbR family)|nr:MmcQ/YjbR family DNA-binding protein [Bacteroidota bacterium]MDG1529294.1 MmcQ/YjbR family DNA-binding protein [Polaribacter sp.]MDG1955197.1 MmcQ/YjbR family DNA-binding protein [Polaribacter sp.]MDG2074108.1 MmcQ/YjbR family DNA-binding protein [Polaribacter sp.]